MPRARLLVTGFGPFPTMPRNPSAAVARSVTALPRWSRLGVEARALVLTTSYAAIGTELGPALATAPDALLMIGVAGRSRRVRIELRGTARRSTLFPDVAGTVAARPGRGKAGATARWSDVPGPAALALFRRHGVPARLSRDAGRYLCNASYFAALGHGLPVVFIHMPPWPTKAPRVEPGEPRHRCRAVDRFTDALADTAVLLLLRRRRAVEGGPRLR